jgi:pimeloyl-ACP methyl ester carboxylesterase
MIALVHGVPETAALWRKLRSAIGEDSVALALPGFGCTLPPGFDTTKDGYVAWLLGELDRLGGHVDLVGHDWGALLTYRVAAAHPDRLRSWVADVGNVAHPDYEWHDVAKIWQTPEAGEAFFAAQAAQPEADRAALFQAAMGIDEHDALELASAADDRMGSCILDLYRSAVPNIYASWGPWQPSDVPGMVLHASNDPFSDDAQAREVAQMFGARVEVLSLAGHFWPYDAPEGAARVLRGFWASLG